MVVTLVRCGTATINQTESISGNESEDWNSRQMKMTADAREGPPAGEEAAEATGGELINLNAMEETKLGDKEGANSPNNRRTNVCLFLP